MSQKTLTLSIYRDGQLVETKALTQDVIKIGKLKSSHLCLEDEAVARMHAVIEVSGSDVRVIDLGSSAGTQLNGGAVDKNAPLKSGDELTFGPFSVRVEVAEAVVAAAPAAAASTRPAAAAAMAAAAPMAPAAPPIQIDLSRVEVQDGRQVAEVIAMLDRTVLDVTHVGQSRNYKSSAPAFLVLGALISFAGLGLFATEMSQDWATYGKAKVEAQQQNLPAPKVPGYGTGALGLGLILLGIAPIAVGAIRLRDRFVQNYTIGEGHNAVFHVPTAGLPSSAEFPLVRGQGEFSLNFSSSMTGEVTHGGQRISLQELVSTGRAASTGGGAFSFPIPNGASARVKHGDVTFLINSVNPGAIVAGRGDVDWPLFAYVGGVGAIAIVFFTLIRMIPDSILAFEMEEETGGNRFVGFMNQPDEVKEEEPPPEQTENADNEEAGGTGQRHKGEEGKMGKPSSKNASGLYAMKGPKDAMPQMARNFDPDMQARSAGILGVMSQQSGHFLASPYGGAFAVGNDDADVWGGLTGTEVGEAYGVGGLGLVGTGRGGGGTGEGSGTGFGGRGTRTPQVRQATAEVQGALDKDIIRRIVRAHINEVRACYNTGLAKNPNLEGRVAVSFVITGTGTVGSAAVQESTVKDGEVGKCIAKAVKRWKFPKPQGGGNVIVSYPFNLSPG
jgi:TonB family protein